MGIFKKIKDALKTAVGAITGSTPATKPASTPLPSTKASSALPGGGIAATIGLPGGGAKTPTQTAQAVTGTSTPSVIKTTKSSGTTSIAKGGSTGGVGAAMPRTTGSIGADIKNYIGNPLAAVQDKEAWGNAAKKVGKMGFIVSSLLPVTRAIGAVAKVSTASTKAANLLKVGGKGIPSAYDIAKGATIGTGEKMAVNTATTAATTSWLTKLAKAATNPYVVAGSLVGIVGSYPFAGYDRGEALRSLEAAWGTAYFNDDVEGMKNATDFQDEMLDPDLWRQMLGAIPFVNIASANEEFYEAAVIQNDINKKITEDKKIQIETGESEDEKWKRLREEEAAQERANIDYYNQERKKMLLWEREASRAGRNEDAAFWAAEREKQRLLEEADRIAIAKFWLAYRKQQQKLYDDSRPSKLGWGLI